MQVVPLYDRRFLVDVDDVLADLRPRFLEVVNDITKGKLTPDDFTSWDYGQYLTVPQREQVNRILSSKGFCLSLKPFQEAQEAIRILRERVSVFAVTWPAHGWFEERYQWLEREYRLTVDDVIFARSKYPVFGKWFLDDNPDNVETWSLGNPGMTAMLWHTRATRDLGQSLLRMHSWGQVIDMVKW